MRASKIWIAAMSVRNCAAVGLHRQAERLDDGGIRGEGRALAIAARRASMTSALRQLWAR